MKTGTFAQYCSSPRRQLGAVAAGIDHAADRGEIAGLELRHVAANLHDAADDFMAGDHGIDGVPPFVAGLVQVGVADAAVEDLDDHIGGERVATLDGKGASGKWRSGLPRISRSWMPWKLKVYRCLRT